MPDGNFSAIASIIAAAIAFGGSIIAIYVTERRKQKSQEIALYESLLHVYMSQLQHMIQSLWYRLNLAHRGGTEFMEMIEKNEYKFIEEKEDPNIVKKKDDYYVISQLYALGCVLAYNRIMLLEGIYAKLEDNSSLYLSQLLL